MRLFLLVIGPPNLILLDDPILQLMRPSEALFMHLEPRVLYVHMRRIRVLLLPPVILLLAVGLPETLRAVQIVRLLDGVELCAGLVHLECLAALQDAACDAAGLVFVVNDEFRVLYFIRGSVAESVLLLNA